MSDGTIDDRDPCAERGSFHLEKNESREEAASGGGPRTGEGDTGCGVRAHPDWWPERYRGFLRSGADHLVKSIGRDDLAAIVLTGSFALDEGSVVFSPAGPLFLSDMDLILVLASRAAHAKAYRRRGELGREIESFFPGAVFSGHVEVGTFVREELRSLPPRPGVFDLKMHGRVLFGDAEVLAAVPGYRDDEIGGEEALLLLENRIMSLLGADRENQGAGDVFRYEVARVYTDIATTALCIDNAYCSGYGRRGRRLRERVDASLSRLVSPSLVSEVERWTAYKLDPSSEVGHSGEERNRAEDLWGRAAYNILDTWKRAAAILLDCRGGVDDATPAESLFRGRGPNDARYNLRFWKGFLSRFPLPARCRLIASLGSTLARKTPLDVIREDGVRLIEHYTGRGGEGIVPGLRLASSGNSGEWGAAAKRAHRLWAEMVFGRKDA